MSAPSTRHEVTDRPRALAAVARHFAMGGGRIGVNRLPVGRIHDTYLVACSSGTRVQRYLLQRLNRSVFPRPMQLVENIARVTEHLRLKVRGEKVTDPERRVLTLVPTRDGRLCHIDQSGEYWRAYLFIDGTHSVETVERATQARQAGAAFGCFIRQLADLPPPPLHEPIPGFHNTLARFEALRRAVTADKLGRVAGSREEIRFAQRREDWVARQQGDPRQPARIVHNDTKVSNLLFDDGTGEVVCVVDLDTVMPGQARHDFGDLARSIIGTGGEDDGKAVSLRLPLFEAVTYGYLVGAAGLLSEAELEALAEAPRLVALELGVRFLTDHLQGDQYFRVGRPGDNLLRSKRQFRLVQSMEDEADAFHRILERASRASVP